MGLNLRSQLGAWDPLLSRPHPPLAFECGYKGQQAAAGRRLNGIDMPSSICVRVRECMCCSHAISGYRCAAPDLISESTDTAVCNLRIPILMPITDRTHAFSFKPEEKITSIAKTTG